MPLTTASDYIYSAFRKCGQLRPGWMPQTELMTDALDEWRLMFDAFNTKRTLGFTIPDYIYPIGSSTGLAGIYGPNIQFSIGPTFTFAAHTFNMSTEATVANTSGLVIGMRIDGVGIQNGTTIQGISINTSITLSLPATASGDVTVSVSANFDGPRPEAIVRMNLYMTSTSPAQPTRIPITMIGPEEWANIPVLSLPAINVTTTGYYMPMFPQGIIHLWPPLNANAIEIFTWGSLTPPTALTATYSAPPGYADLIVWMLAKRMYYQVTKDVLVHKVPYGVLIAQSERAKRDVKAVNAPMPKLRNDFTGGSNITAGSSDWDLLLTGIPY